ncbi:molybdopterin-dependent oxidoreductase [Stappia sp.]|uniref:nitrate reductase n=1 Tax=Stappia sp. TaxID=1870903 RepID=UPI003D0E5B24
MPDSVRTTCPYCGVGCGVIATRQDDGRVSVAGDPGHPANFGRLCSKGSALADTLADPDRLLFPEIAGKRVGWDAALDMIATRFAEMIAEHGPDSVAFYVSGQILTEDYYVANKLMKGFIGSANIDTNSRLCMASSVAGHRRAFGSDTVPGTYEDLEEADLVVLVGSNLAWCHPVLYQRLEAARARRPNLRLVVIDPRRTATAASADLHLALAPDTDVALYNGLLAALESAGRIDRTYVAEHTHGLEAALEIARGFDIATVSTETRLAAADIARFYQWVAETPKTVTVYSQGVNQSVVGTDKVNAILNTHLAAGRIGRPGCGPFSVTGQPNAMGGREVGGLANMLAAHMAIESPAHRGIVQGFWKSPRIAERPGLKAVEMFQALREGRIKAIWIMATNPVDSLPDADGVREALAGCDFVVVSDVTRRTDTVPFADVLLPAAAWGEKDGTVTNSERRISRQRAFRVPPGEARTDWWALAQVARRMGFADGFAYRRPADIYREHAALSSEQNDGSRDFDIGAHAAIDQAEYEALEPFQWPLRADGSGAARFFAEGGFFTADGRAAIWPVAYQAPRKRERRYPLVLNTGRIRDQWHMMTRTGLSPRLLTHMAEPFCEVHPRDAERAGVNDAQVVVLESPHGRVLLRALVSDRAREGSVFVPMHWSDQFAAAGRVDALVGPETDPVSGQPGSKFTPVALRPFVAGWYGFAVLRERPEKIDTDYWAIAPVEGGWRVELAGRGEGTADALFRVLAASSGEQGDRLSYRDTASGEERLACWEGGRLVAALFTGPAPVGVSRAWACGLLATEFPLLGDRASVLAGRPGGAAPDIGAIVCSCRNVGLNQITAAIEAGACDVATIGEAVDAGTQCGSCRSEIGTILARVQAGASQAVGTQAAEDADEQVAEAV